MNNIKGKEETHKMNSLRDFATLIRKRRMDLDVTQTDLSLVSGVERSWICEIELGKRTGANYKSIKKVLDALNIEMVLVIKKE